MKQYEVREYLTFFFDHKYLMVLKFEDYIKEGLWSGTVNRSKTDGNRAEDTNLHMIKGVDIGLPFLIADRNLVVKDKDRFNMSEMEQQRKSIESSGWRIPTINDLKPTINENELVYTLTNDGVVLGNPNYNNGECVLFEGNTKWGFSETYWLVDSEEKHEPSGKVYPLCWDIIKDDAEKYQGIPRSRFPYCSSYNKKQIRLIKDK